MSIFPLIFRPNRGGLGEDDDRNSRHEFIVLFEPRMMSQLSAADGSHSSSSSSSGETEEEPSASDGVQTRGSRARAAGVPRHLHHNRFPSIFDFGALQLSATIFELLLSAALSENRSSGNPCASEHVIAHLPSVEVDKEDEVCPVCQDTFEKIASKMPCGHLFHKDCLIPWLKQRNTCPTCRCEVETADAEYNAANQGKIKPLTTESLSNNEDGNSEHSSSSAAAVAASSVATATVSLPAENATAVAVAVAKPTRRRRNAEPVVRAPSTIVPTVEHSMCTRAAKRRRNGEGTS